MDENDAAIMQSLLAQDKFAPPQIRGGGENVLLDMPPSNAAMADQQYYVGGRQAEDEEELVNQAELVNTGQPKNQMIPLAPQLAAAMRMVRRPELGQYSRPSREELMRRRSAPPPPIVTKG